MVHGCRYMATNEECKFVYNLVQVHIPHPVTLVMLKAKVRRNPLGKKETPSLVCLKQIHEVFVGDVMSYKYLHSLATIRDPAVKVEGEDLKVLIRLEVLPANTPSASCITTAMAHGILDNKQGVSAPIRAANRHDQGLKRALKGKGMHMARAVKLAPPLMRAPTLGVPAVVVPMRVTRSKAKLARPP